MSYPPPAMPPFIEPATPVLYSAPPRGADWLHEVEFDGWRVQLHKYGNFVQLYSRGRHEAARRLSDLVAALASIPAQSYVIEGEVVACNNRGLPDFPILPTTLEIAPTDHLCIRSLSPRWARRDPFSGHRTRRAE